MRKTLFFLLAIVALAAAAPSSDEDFHASVALDPAAVDILGDELNQEPQEVARQILLDVGLPAVTVMDDDGVAVMDSFITEALQEKPATYNVLGRKWRKFKKMLKAEEKQVQKKEKKAEKAFPGPFNKQARHGLSKLEYRYMRMYKNYLRLHKAYRRGCGRSRFWMKLNNWHWRVLLAASKKLRRLVGQYKNKRTAYRTLKGRLHARFAWANSRSPYKSASFFRNVIAHSKAAIKATQDKAAAEEKKKDDAKEKAQTLANKMQVVQLLDEGVAAVAQTLNALQMGIESI